MNKTYRKVDPVALKQLIDNSGVSYRQTKRSYAFTCPRCDKKDKLMMFKSDGRFVCWVCAESSGFRGRPEFALPELLGMTRTEVERRIYGDAFEATPSGLLSLQLADFFDDDEVVPADLLATVRSMPWPLTFYPIDHQHARRGRDYLAGRGIDLELAQRYELRYCPVQRRVIFPIKVGPKVLGWQARAIFQTEWEDDEGKTQSCPKILTTGKRDHVLMFQDRLVGSEHAVLTEGPIDGIKADLCGGNVTTMGKVVSEQQIKIIRGSGVKKLYLGLDPDAATETQRLAYEFGDLELFRLLPAPGFKDLGEMTPEGVYRQFLSAPRIRPGMLFLHFRGA